MHLYTRRRDGSSGHVIPDDSEEIERGLVAVNSPDGNLMWGDPDLNKDDDWEVVTPKQELRVPVTLADHLKSKRATKPLQEQSQLSLDGQNK